jgi:glycosyltransferase involved in cell wall biosynthesis
MVNRLAYKRWFQDDVNNAARVVVNSRGTALRLQNLLGRSVDAVAVPGARWNLMRDVVAHNRLVAEPYILAVATKEPRKNLSSLIAAFAGLKFAGAVPDHRLVLVGATGWGRALSLPQGAGEWLLELGYVEDNLMASLYAHAEVFVQPSIYEGFGMPAAEAASFGVRIVATDIPELREAAGPSGIFVDPTVEGLTNGIKTALVAPKPPPFHAGTWEEAAKVMKLALEGAVHERRRL